MACDALAAELAQNVPETKPGPQSRWGLLVDRCTINVGNPLSKGTTSARAFESSISQMLPTSTGAETTSVMTPACAIVLWSVP
jgi:hypothetical protein